MLVDDGDGQAGEVDARIHCRWQCRRNRTGGNRHALPRPRTAKAVSPPIYTLPFFPSSDVLIHANELSIECPEFRIPLSFSELADNERINSKKKSKVVLIQQKIIKSKPQIRDL